MIISRFLKPKWRRANPETRKQAVNSLTDQGVLSEIGRSDPDPAVRRMACKKLHDVEVLAVVAESDGDAGVREFAAARQRRLLCGTEPDSPPLEKRLAHLAGSHSVRLLEQVAAQGKEPQLRLQAVQCVDDADVLSEIAARDSSAPVRLAAAERLGDKDALERALRKSRKKDKKVYRLARAKLREIAEREQAPARIRGQCEGLCERLEKLGRGQTWVQDNAVLEHVHKQWQALESQAETQLVERYRAARQRFLEGYQAYCAGNQLRIREQENRADVRRRKQELLDELDVALASNSETVLQQVLERVPLQWEGLEYPSEPDAAEMRLAADFADSLNKVRIGLKQFQQGHARQARLKELTGEIESLFAERAPLHAAAIAAVEREAGDITDGVGQGDDAQRLRQGLAKLTRRFEKQRRKAIEKQEQLAGRVQELEQALETGVLKKATSAYQKLDADIELIEASGLLDQQVRPAKQALRAMLPRLRELQNWRKWGTDQHRESLCRSMEQLVDADLEPELLADHLQELQIEWKGLDRSGSPGNRALWDRFHTASDRVFERCGPYFEEQARQRETSRTQREALCADLEEFLEKIDWESMDWKKAVRAEREMRNAWSALGPVEPKARRELDKRFRKALKVLNKHLAEERTRNQAHKQRLITEALALRDAPDLKKAIQELKNLQQQWHTTVAGKHGHENRIWREFRTACDEVFARRHKQDETRREALKANQKTRQGVCEELEVLVQSASVGERELQQGFQALEIRWNAAAELEVPQSTVRELLRRWDQAARRYRGRLREFRYFQAREQLERLRRRAALCDELEGCLEHPGDGSLVLQDIQSRWESLPALGDAVLQDRIDRRYRGAHRALAEQGELLEAQLKGMAGNQEKRENLCLHMEILAGMESPPEAAQQRLAVQVDRLSEHLRQGEEDKRREAVRLEKEWYLSGPASEQARVSLEQRFLRALQVMSEGRVDTAIQGGPEANGGVGSPASGFLRSKEQTLHQA